MFNLEIKRDANAGAQFVELRERPHLCSSFAHFWALPQNEDRPSDLHRHDLPSISVQAGLFW